mmetsp:Transcript_18799/g.34084  ORF Transcript_18799/g.34084 Transcript_18799/m.34084 type:complete len:817 (-) Transcript_18799:1699-4149(-)
MTSFGSFFTLTGSFYPPPSYTTQEVSYFNYLFQCIGGGRALGGSAVVEFLKRSGLGNETLRSIWNIASVRGMPDLDEFEFFLCLKFVALCQSGYQPLRQYVSLEVPLPRFAGVEYPSPEEEDFTDFVEAEERASPGDEDFTEYMSSSPSEPEFKIQVPDFLKLGSPGTVLADWEETPTVVKTEWYKPEVTEEVLFEKGLEEFTKVSVLQRISQGTEDLIGLQGSSRETVTVSGSQSSSYSDFHEIPVSQIVIDDPFAEIEISEATFKLHGQQSSNLFEVQAGQLEVKVEPNGGLEQHEEQAEQEKEQAIISSDKSDQSSEWAVEEVDESDIEVKAKPDDPFAEIEDENYPKPSSFIGLVPNSPIKESPRSLMPGSPSVPQVQLPEDSDQSSLEGVGEDQEDEEFEEDWDDFKEVSPEPTAQHHDLHTLTVFETKPNTFNSNGQEQNFFDAPSQAPQKDLFKKQPEASLFSGSEPPIAFQSFKVEASLFKPPQTGADLFQKAPLVVHTASIPKHLFDQPKLESPKKHYDPETVRNNAELLAELKQTLTEQGRLEEALACQVQQERVMRLKNLKILKTRAAEQDEYEDAIHLRGIIAEVEACLISVDDVAEWLKPKQTISLKSIVDEVKSMFGEDVANLFAGQYKAAESLTNIEEAVTTLQTAKRTRTVLKKIQHQVEGFKRQSESFAARLSDEIRKANVIFSTLKPQLVEFAEDASYQAYCKGLCEVCKVARRLLSSTEVARTFLKVSCDLMTLEADLTSLSSQLPIKFDELKDHELCGLCLGATDESLTTIFNGQYHITCGNFWLHRVSINAPRVK